MDQDLFLPVLSHFENDNFWTASAGRMCYRVDPVKGGEDTPPSLSAQVWEGPWRLQDSNLAPLTASEAFYLGTLGGGAFFGKVGAFLPEYVFDALVIDDSRYTPRGSRSIPERLERTIYLSDDRDLEHKFAAGIQLF